MSQIFGRRSSSGSLAMFAAMRHTDSQMRRDKKAPAWRPGL